VSVGAASDVIAQADTVFALARTGDQVLAALPQVLGSPTTPPYAALGGAISLYVRTAALGAKYSSFGVVDPTTSRLVRIANGDAFTSAIERAHARLGSSLALLRTHHVNATVVAADYEIGGVDHAGDPSGKLDALGDDWDGYVNSRVLASIGGFAAPR
jgi:hypothetical protein